MRTTLDVADDVLFAAKDLARHEKKSLGQVISELARKAFAQPNDPVPTAQTASSAYDKELAALGIFPLPGTGRIVTNEMIDRIRDEEGI